MKVGLGTSAAGKQGGLLTSGFFPELGGIAQLPTPQDLPRTRTLHLSALDNAKWDVAFEQYGAPDEEGSVPTESYYEFDEPRAFKGGGTYELRFNTGVLGPRLAAADGVFRDGDTISGDLPLHADGGGHTGWTTYSSVKTTLYRNGTELTENSDELDGNSAGFAVPSDAADYRLTTSVRRDPALGTRHSALGTRHSAQPPPASTRAGRSAPGRPRTAPGSPSPWPASTRGRI